MDPQLSHSESNWKLLCQRRDEGISANTESEIIIPVVLQYPLRSGVFYNYQNHGHLLPLEKGVYFSKKVGIMCKVMADKPEKCVNLYLSLKKWCFQWSAARFRLLRYGKPAKTVNRWCWKARGKSAPSFKRYIADYQPKRAIRFSRRSYLKNGMITNIPLYLAKKTKDLLWQSAPHRMLREGLDLWCHDFSPAVASWLTSGKARRRGNTGSNHAESVEDTDLSLTSQWLRKEYVLKWHHDANGWMNELEPFYLRLVWAYRVG